MKIIAVQFYHFSTFFIVTLVLSFLGSCQADTGENTFVLDSKTAPSHQWIQQEGIRAGFMSSTKGDLTKIPQYVQLSKSIGLNTAIVYGCSFAETPNHLKYYRQWLQLCNQADLHVFVFYPWQPPVGNKCRPVVFSDGTEGLFPCPLDDKLWQDYLVLDMALKLANLSVESPNFSFDGYFLDMEMYRTEKQPVAKKHYSFETCFCDSCFSSFLFKEWYVGSTLPPIEKKRRKQWLMQKDFLSDYYAYLQSQVEMKAELLKKRIHAINPNLLFGVYPALNSTNWVHNTVARVFGRDSFPVISFSTDTYGYYSKPWGADRIPSDLPGYFEKYDINGIYAAGYLFRKYTSTEIGKQMVESCQRGQGYWLFRMHQLLEENLPTGETLARGSRTDYRQALRKANDLIDQR